MKNLCVCFRDVCCGCDQQIGVVLEPANAARCPVFDLPELGKKMHVDHIRPLARGGKHEASNLQILPIGINMRKGTKCPR